MVTCFLTKGRSPQSRKNHAESDGLKGQGLCSLLKLATRFGARVTPRSTRGAGLALSSWGPRGRGNSASRAIQRRPLGGPAGAQPREDAGPAAPQEGGSRDAKVKATLRLLSEFCSARRSLSRPSRTHAQRGGRSVGASPACGVRAQRAGWDGSEGSLNRGSSPGATRPQGSPVFPGKGKPGWEGLRLPSASPALRTNASRPERKHSRRKPGP